MSEADAIKLATIFGGEAWHSGGGIWLVKLTNTEGNLVVFSDDLVCEYTDEDAFHAGTELKAIVLVPAKAPIA